VLIHNWLPKKLARLQTSSGILPDDLHWLDELAGKDSCQRSRKPMPARDHVGNFAPSMSKVKVNRGNGLLRGQ